MSEQFARIEGAEIFAAGTWNGMTFSEADLDRIVKSFEALELAGKVPLKLGHEGPDVREDPTTQFAMGWVERIWRDGRKLLADLDVPNQVHKLIQDGFLKFVSVELLKNVKASNQEIPWVLDAVALLGSDPPAVGVLRDIRALTMSRSAASLLRGERVTFARADYVPPTNFGGHRNMFENDKQPTMQELLDRMIAMQNQLSQQAAENAELKAKLVQFSTVKTKLDTVMAENKARDIKAQRDKIVALIEEAVRNEDILPAARERFLRTHRVDDDESVMVITEEDVKEFVRENPNPRKKVSRKAPLNTLSSVADDVPPGTPVDREGVARVTAWFKEQGIKSPTAEDWISGTKAVFAALPDFAERYKAHADAIYDGRARN
jgi:hypothetical protein